MASDYFSEISRGGDGEVDEIARELVTPYRRLSELIREAAKKESFPDGETGDQRGQGYRGELR